ncbi:MAG TPA: amidohydrolase family protein [Candidatus Binataceae bacterium]
MMSGIVSADSHVMEPGDLWEKRLDRKYREHSPKVGLTDSGVLLFSAPGVRSFPVAMGFGMGLNGQRLYEHMAKVKDLKAAPAGGWDPMARLKDQDVDGVTAEIMYTTLGMPLFGMNDLELQAACFSVYNDFVGEYCSAAPRRLYGICLVPLTDIPAAVKELERCAKLGFRGAQIWGVPPADHPYYDTDYDPFWAAAQSLNMVLSLHVATGKSFNEAPKNPEKPLPRMQMLMTRMNTIHDVQKSILQFVFGAVFDRFPDLKIVSAEHDAGWAAHMVHRMDRQYEKWASDNEKSLKLVPSDYFRRNLRVTFQDDPMAGMTAKFYGEDNFMWGSDYPHSDATWPHSREAIARSMAGVPEDIAQKITSLNAARLYRMDLPN